MLSAGLPATPSEPLAATTRRAGTELAGPTTERGGLRRPVPRGTASRYGLLPTFLRPIPIECRFRPISFVG
jgi:hypothetical protein